MRLTLIVSSLGPGGAERVFTLLANRWAAQGHEVSLLTLAGREISPFFALDERINLIPLGISSASTGIFSAVIANFGRARALRRAVSDSAPDAIVSFQDTTNILTLLACSSLGKPIIVSERVDPTRYSIGRIWSLLRTRVYPHAHHLVVQTRAAYNNLPPAQKQRATTIPNPVLPTSDQDVTPVASRPLLAAAGRFTPQKGFDILLRAFAKLHTSHPSWTLSIFGQGDDQDELENLAKELGIADRVIFPGKVDNLPAHLRHADLFALPSRFEGFPNVLLEAMASGLPCIAADCPSGPAEIITHEQNGLLIPPDNPTALTEALDRLISDETLRTALGQQATKVVDRFSLERVGAMWDALLPQSTEDA